MGTASAGGTTAAQQYYSSLAHIWFDSHHAPEMAVGIRGRAGRPRITGHVARLGQNRAVVGQPIIFSGALVNSSARTVPAAAVALNVKALAIIRDKIRVPAQQYTARKPPVPCSLSDLVVQEHVPRMDANSIESTTRCVFAFSVRAWAMNSTRISRAQTKTAPREFPNW